MNNQEKLIEGVLNGDISIIDDVMAENIDVSFNGNEALRAAKMELFKAKSSLIKAESIVGMLEIGCAANARFERKEYIDEDMPLYEVIQKMADGNEDSKKILCEIVKRNKYTLSKRIGYIFDMYSIGIKGEAIVSVYDFCDKSIFNLFDALDYETKELTNHLEEIKLKCGGSS